MAQLAAGQVAAAHTNALKAAELAPQSAAVRDTLRRVEAARKEKVHGADPSLCR